MHPAILVTPDERMTPEQRDNVARLASMQREEALSDLARRGSWKLRMTLAREIETDQIFQQQLAAGLLERRGKALIFGGSGTGKSTLAIDVGSAIGSGRPVGHRATLRGVVGYVCAEAADGTRRRIAAYCKHHDLRPEQLHLALYEQPLGFNVGRIDELVQTMRALSDYYEQPVRLVVIDTLAANEPGKEDSEHFGRVVDAQEQLARELDCCALVVHHSGKDGASGARGHSSLYAAMDTVIEVTSTGPGVSVATVVKQRDGASGEAFTFALQPVGIGFRETPGSAFRETVTACVIEYRGAAEPRRPQLKDGHQTRCFDALLLDARKRRVTRWPLKEAAELFRQHHEATLGDRETLHRNTPKKTLEALAKRGAVLIDSGFVVLQEA